MIITREMDYAVRAVRALCTANIKSAAEIVAEEKIPSAFAYKVLKKLGKAGLVEIVRGPAGGYRLLKTPEQFTLFDIMSSVDREMFITECLDQNYQCSRSGGLRCSIHKEYIRVQDLFEQELKRKNFEEFLKIQ